MYLKNINHTYFLLCIQKINNVFPPYKKLAYNSVLTKLLTIFIKNVQQVPKQCFKCIQFFYYAYKKVHIIIYTVFLPFEFPKQKSKVIIDRCMSWGHKLLAPIKQRDLDGCHCVLNILYCSCGEETRLTDGRMLIGAIRLA